MGGGGVIAPSAAAVAAFEDEGCRLILRHREAAYTLTRPPHTQTHTHECLSVR